MAFFDLFKKNKAETKLSVEEEKQIEESYDSGLEKTKTGFFSKLGKAIAGKSTVDADFLDEIEDGARATITEEALSMIIFNEAKRKDFFRTTDAQTMP